VQVIDTVSAWRKTLDHERGAGRSVGLVLTLGNLHAGHASLISRAAAENEVCAVTVFVNPLQFGAGEDFDRYPRTLPADVEMAAAHGAHYVFAPLTAEMYPTPLVATVSAGPLATRWEGAARPGHFDGVATVVVKLFAQAGPCRSYFGEKDYQQLVIVRRLVADLSLPVEVVGCPTVREPDGLALSSRNAYLSAEQRRSAPVLYRALRVGAAALRDGARARVAEEVLFNKISAVTAPDYAAVVDATTLEPAASAIGELRLLVAARFGTTRLIDNVGVEL